MNAVKTNPKNDRSKREYLVWLKEANERSGATVEHARHAIDRLENYAGFKDFGVFNKELAIAFKRHLLGTTVERTGKPMAVASVYSILRAVQEFLRWLCVQPGYRRRIKVPDIAYLSLSQGEQRQAHATGAKDYASVEDYRRAILAMPSSSEIEKRDQAMIAMLLATAMRDDALVSLKLEHVNITRRRVFQDPRDVRTKFRKSIETFFFPVGEDVVDIVSGWLHYLVTEKGFGPEDPLFPKTEVRLDTEGNFGPV